MELRVENLTKNSYFHMYKIHYERVPMEMTLRINAEQLDSELMQNIRTMFKDKEIEITVNEVDETEYLFRSPENKKQLLKAIEDVEQGKNLISVPLNELEKLA